MLRDTADRTAATVVVGVVLWALVRQLGVPELWDLTVMSLTVGVSHGLAGMWPLSRAGAVVAGVHDLGTDAPAWLEEVPFDESRPVRVVGCALSQPTWDRLERAAEAAADEAGVKAPGVMVGRRMRGRRAFAVGPRRRDSTLCISVALLDAAHDGEMTRAFAGELRWVRRRVPLWGTAAAGLALFVAREVLSGLGVL